MFKVGDLVFKFENEHYHLFHILMVSEGFLVRDYLKTSTFNSGELENRLWLKRIKFDDCLDYQYFKNESVSEKDKIDIHRFLVVEKGLNARRKRTVLVPTLAKAAIQNQQFEEALELLTEWAMLDKYNSVIYLLREECLRKLDRIAEADYERHVYNTLTGN